MATFKALILPHQKKDDGSYNVKIRVTHNRKVKYLRTPYYVFSNDLSKRKKNGKEELKIKNQAILDSVDSTILGYRKKIASAGMDIDAWTIERLMSFLESDTASFRLDFMAYWEKVADGLVAKGKNSTGKLYYTSLKTFKRFIGRDSMDISEVTIKLIRAFEGFLKNDSIQRYIHGKIVVFDEKRRQQTISIYLRNMKAVHELAKKEYNDEDNSIINIPNSPFSRFEIPASQPTKHRTLTIEQVQMIIDYPYTVSGNTMADLAKDLFLMSFAMMGVNSADLYDLDSLEGDILAYNRKKTRDRRNDKARMEVFIEPEIRGIVRKYRGKNKAFMFSDRYKNEKDFNRAINAGLDKIGAAIGVPDLTYYYARHTMASLCANKLGIDIARVDEMLNHSDSKLRLARVYIEKDYKPLWEANRKLLDLFDWSFYTNKAEE